MATLGFLRLAGDLRRHCRRGHLLEVRGAIADPAVSLDCAAVAGVAAGKPLNSLGFLSDAAVLCRAPSRQTLVINHADHWLFNANDELGNLSLS